MVIFNLRAIIMNTIRRCCDIRAKTNSSRLQLVTTPGVEAIRKSLSAVAFYASFTANLVDGTAGTSHLPRTYMLLSVLLSSLLIL